MVACTMKTVLIVALFAAVRASFETCGAGGVSVSHLEADPPSAVAAGQPVTMRVRFNVPDGTWIPDGRLRIATALNFVPVDTWEEPLCSHVRCPLQAGEQEVVLTQPFPPRIWGRVTADVTAVNASGAPLLCARWSVWATGTSTNVTGRWGGLFG